MLEKERTLEVLKEMEATIGKVRAELEAENYGKAAEEGAKLSANLGELEEKLEAALL